jgi:hypothetical protein
MGKQRLRVQPKNVNVLQLLVVFRVTIHAIIQIRLRLKGPPECLSENGPFLVPVDMVSEAVERDLVG